MEELIKEQEIVVRGISRILPNYKKMGKDNFSKASAEERLRRLRVEWERCQQVHLHLEIKATARDRETRPYFTEAHFDRAEEAFEQASDFFCELVESLKAPPETSFDASTLNEPVASASKVTKLPRIAVPKFDGRYSEWPTFFDLFTSLVVKNAALDDVQRLFHLKGALEGRAASVISHVKVTAANFAPAWKAVQSRYENKRMIVGALVGELLQYAPLVDESGEGLAKLRDRSAENLAQLANLGCPTEQWDDLLVQLIVRNFDPKSREEWELSLGASREPPTYGELELFLEARIRALENIHFAAEMRFSAAEENAIAIEPSHVRSHAAAATNTTKTRCPKCSQNHLLFRCPVFRGMTTAQKRELVKARGCCFNCLRADHSASNCPSASRCIQCGKPHHTALHQASSNPRSHEMSSTLARGEVEREGGPTALLNCSARSPENSSRAVLLATAIVRIETPDGGTRAVRALLDQGSEATFVSESLVQALRLPKRPASVTVKGAGDAPVGRVKARVHFRVRGDTRVSPAFEISALVLTRITSYAPRREIDIGAFDHLRGLTLADPDPRRSLPVDLLIGADHYGALLRAGLRRGEVGTPIAQETAFGWVVSGPTRPRPDSRRATAMSLHCHADEELKQQLRAFWEIEEASPRSTLSPDETKCEEHFKATVARRRDGRYVVRLPLRADPPLPLGASWNRAISILRGVERRLRGDPALEVAYYDFLTEYEALNHMEEASGPSDQALFVYLPHHPVVKRTDDGTPKVRVVFNASSPTSNGRSLNDFLLPGPKLQLDIFAVLLRWRLPCIALKADIAKMFRQIRVHDDDADLQRIAWRREPHCDPSAFRLTTVTYGTACAPYLAQRVLLELAKDEGNAFPRACSVLRKNFYVDDALFGADSEDEARSCRLELTQLLRRGGFELAKWAASTPLVLAEGPESRVVDLPQGSPSNHPVLGVDWSPETDSFGFSVERECGLSATKRDVLSTIARLYDPLGWAAPVVIKAKIMLQELWLRGSEWDDPIPAELGPAWSVIVEELPALRNARIPRWLGVRQTPSDDDRYELHGFADASSHAYGAVVYLVSRSPPGTSTGTRVTLVASRTKVAPLKTVSIPRLELCAAALLAKLLRRIADETLADHLDLFAWTDSQVVLAWLARTPSTWTVFVANRVGLIHETLPGTSWRHVGTADNPADCASRGLLASELLHHDLWWRGPTWLSGPRSGWPQARPDALESPNLEVRVNTARVQDVEESPLAPLPNSVSSWAKLLRVTAGCYRFVAALRRKAGNSVPYDASATIRRSRMLWLRWLQQSAFKPELNRVERQLFVGEASPLRRLNPFVDAAGLLRVGGRLSQSSLSYDEMHPIILPKHPLVELLVDAVHLTTLHGGPQLTLSVLRRTYWPLGARELVRKVLGRCVTCARHRATPASQVMASLPRARVDPSRPFSHVGVDYAGPLSTRMGKGRGYKSQKGYISIFVCFATRAVHLELVSDCTSTGFLAALRRFVSRRGRPTEIYSDNGTNFRGAARELATMSRSAVNSPEVTEFLGQAEIAWHFSPPGAPHFGGLWEAGVKAVKRHLVRVVGSHTLTFEEMATLLCMIEACLNSRPLTPLSRNPDDYAALTPGHFLTGTPTLTLPGERPPDSAATTLSRWQTVDQMRANFWKQWQREYLHTLQERSKWWRTETNLRPGEMVVIREPNYPPAVWRLARVETLHPGVDNRVRVVTVRTAGGKFKRPVAQLVRLPVETPEDPAPSSANAC